MPLAVPWHCADPDMQISRIRLSDKTSRLHPRHVVPKRSQADEPEVPVQVTLLGMTALVAPMSRRKYVITARMNERDYPHIVELALPPEGFRARAPGPPRWSNAR